MLKFVLCDDNIHTVTQFAKTIKKILDKNNLEGDISLVSVSAEEVYEYVQKNEVNVLVLDIQLKSSITGLDIAKKLRETNKDCYIIFMTAHFEFAMMAYKLKTFDYLPKPITYERLEDTLIRLYEDVECMKKTYLKIDSRDTLVDENLVYFIKREGMKLIYHTTQKDFHAYSSFAKIQDSLPTHFVRCHKSFVVNINRISNIDTKNNLVFFLDNSSCEIGPTYKADFIESVKNKLSSNKSPFASTLAKL